MNSLRKVIFDMSQVSAVPRPLPFLSDQTATHQTHLGGYSRHARVRSALSPPFVSFGPLPWIRTNPGGWPKKTEEYEKKDPRPSPLRVGESSSASRQLQRTSAAIAATHGCAPPRRPLSFLSAHCLGSEPTQAGGRKKRKSTKKKTRVLRPCAWARVRALHVSCNAPRRL